MSKKAIIFVVIVMMLLILLGEVACAEDHAVQVTPASGEMKTFSNLEEAVLYANGNGGGTIELLSDVNFFHPFFNGDVTHPDYSRPYYTVVISSNIVLLGNGHTINVSPGAELKLKNGQLTLGMSDGTNVLVFDGGNNWYSTLKDFVADPATVLAEGWGDFGKDTHMGCTPMICVDSGSTLSMNSGVTLQNRIYDGLCNTIYDGAALAVCVLNNGVFNLRGGTIQNFHSYPMLHRTNVADAVSAVTLRSNGVLNMTGGILRNNSVLNNTINIPASDYDHAQGAGVELIGDGPACGGALYATDSDVTISGGSFYSNAADSGGAIYLDYCKNVRLSNVEIYGNTASIPIGIDDDWGYGWGGGIYQSWNSEITLGNNCFIYGNEADCGGGVFIGGSYFWWYSWKLMHSHPLLVGYYHLNESITMEDGSAIWNNIAKSEGSDIDSMSYVQLTLVNASTMGKTFRDTGFRIQGWFQDYDPRYDVEGNIDSFTEYTPEEVETKAMASGIELIAAPRTLTSKIKIIYDPNGGNGEMVPTEGNADESVHIASNKFSYPFSTFVEWNTKEDGTGTAYAPGDAYTMTSEDVTLYAQWKTPVTIEKIWDDDSDRDKIRPRTLDTHLLIGSERQPDLDQENTFTLREDQITHVWSTTVDLPAKDYSALWAEEEEVPGYEQADCRRSVTSNGTLKFVFENRHEVSEFRVYKEWVGIDGEPPEISLHLYNKDVRLPDKPVMRDNWYIWKLPIADNDGNPEYYVLEEPMRGFMTEYLHNGELADCARNGDTIRNTLVPLTGERHPLVFWLTVLAAAGFGLMLCRRRK